MRKTAVIVGLLFWISNLATLTGSVVAGTIPSPADALTSMYPHGTQVVVGTLIAHVNDVAIIAYAVVLFTVLKRWNEALALSYVAFKMMASQNCCKRSGVAPAVSSSYATCSTVCSG
jgi:hypothetical protein